MVGCIRVGRVCRVKGKVSVRIKIRFSFIGAILHIAMTWPNIGATNTCPRLE